MKCSNCGCLKKGDICVICGEGEEKQKDIKKPKAVSKKRASLISDYSRKKALFLAKHPWCPVFPNLRTKDIHHKAGKSNDELYMDERYWLAVSRKGHIKIELNPEWAKREGYSISRLKKSI